MTWSAGSPAKAQAPAAPMGRVKPAETQLIPDQTVSSERVTKDSLLKKKKRIQLNDDLSLCLSISLSYLSLSYTNLFQIGSNHM